MNRLNTKTSELEMLLHISQNHHYFEEIFENNQMKIDILQREKLVNVDYYI